MWGLDLQEPATFNGVCIRPCKTQKKTLCLSGPVSVTTFMQVNASNILLFHAVSNFSWKTRSIRQWDSHCSQKNFFIMNENVCIVCNPARIKTRWYDVEKSFRLTYSLYKLYWFCSLFSEQCSWVPFFTFYSFKWGCVYSTRRYFHHSWAIKTFSNAISKSHSCKQIFKMWKSWRCSVCVPV